MAATNSPRYRLALSLYLKECPDRFKRSLLEPPSECQRPDINYAVDEPGQLILCQLAYTALAPRGLPISVAELVRYHDENPVVADLVRAIHADLTSMKPDYTMARVWP
jgi:spore coat polysaccharide biosynthesis protein SpsF (cytidylyltransferase family)